MTSEKQKELTAKYKEFFQHLEDYGTPMINPDQPVMKEIKKLQEQESIVVPMQFGFECSDGWYVLLDELMGNIKNHIWNENQHRENQFRFKIIRFLDGIRYKLPWKWKKLKNFIFWFVNKFPRGIAPMPPIQVTQIKEKYGGLCFYYYGGDDYIDGLVSFAESFSYRICEQCGSTTGVGQTSGWIYTICWDCYEKHERASDLPWHPKKKYLIEDNL